MQVFRELYIRGEPDQLRATADAICEAVSGDWSRDTATEVELNKFSTGRTFCFDRSAKADRPAAGLFLGFADHTTLRVTNVVPLDSGDFDFQEYNAVLEEFVTQFVEPAARRTGARVELTEPDADIEHWLSPDAARKLRAFCAVANKRTGASHPADKRFWYDFVVAAHRSDSTLTASTLARWLREAGGWDEEWSDKLAAQYEQARGLLQFAERQAVGA